MAITQDGWFNDTMIKALSNTIALNLADTTPGIYKGALFGGGLSPNFSQANPAYGTSPLNSAETTGPGYTAGGVDMTVSGFGELAGSTNKIGWKFSPIGWTEATIAAEGLLIYVPSLANRAVLLRSFGSEYDAQDGSYSITFHADGVWRTVLRNTA